LFAIDHSYSIDLARASITGKGPCPWVKAISQHHWQLFIGPLPEYPFPGKSSRFHKLNAIQQLAKPAK
jgi:hypothetical protein